MSGKRVLCSVLASVVVLAAVPACKPSSVELAGMGYAYARVAAVAVPDYDASLSELEAHLGAVPFRVHLFVDPTATPDESDEFAPVVTTFGFMSDGMVFSETGLEPDVSLDTILEVEFDDDKDSGEDVPLVYANWTHLPQYEAENTRLCYRQYSLSSIASESLPTRFGAAVAVIEEAGHASTNQSTEEELPLRVHDLDGDGASAEIDLFVNQGLLTWDIDPNADTDDFFIPLAMLATITLEPEGFEPYTEPLLPDGMTQVTPLSADPDEVIERFKTLVMEAELGPHVVVEPDSGSAGAINSLEGIFQFRLRPETNEGRDAAVSGVSIIINSNYPNLAAAGPVNPQYILVAPVPGAAPSEPSGDPLPHMYNGFPEIGLVAADDVQVGDTVMSATVFVANGFRDLTAYDSVGFIIHNIPVSGESLFTPDEPHTIELPYTFWLTIAPVELPPQESGLPDFAGEPNLLRVIVSPAQGGSVTVSTPDGTQEPDYPAEGDWQGSLAFDYTVDGEAEVTLSAEPAEGYRFVAWHTDDLHAEIQDPGAPTTTLIIHPVVREEMGPVLTTVTAYFAAYVGEPPQDSFFDTMMGATIRPVSETIEDESGCESIVSIDYEAVDLTGGQKPISYVQLDINGEELTSWSGTPTDRYHSDTLVESDCSEVLVIALSAINSEGQTMTATKEAPIPPLSTHFEYGVLDGPEGGDCKMQLVIDLQAVDLTVPDNPLTSVVVKGNGSTWYSSGSISTDSLEHSFGRLVDCGNTYLVEVIGTDSDGNRHTYRETVEIPEGSPPPDDDPVPPSQTTLYAAIAASAQCTSSGPECSCQLSVSFDGKDLTGGTYPVTRVVLRVNGQVWHDSGSISTVNYHQVVHKTVNCGTTFDLQLTVDNAVGQTATSSGSLTTPTP